MDSNEKMACGHPAECLDTTGPTAKLVCMWCSALEAAKDYAEVAMRNIGERDAALAEVENWRKYAKLLGEEIDELAPSASNRGWKSTRYEAGVELRKALGITDA
jgi:hypothetical protein